MRLSVKLLSVTAGAAVAICATPATAAGAFLFELSGGKTATFVIDTDLPPNFGSSSPLIGDQIRYDGVAGTFGDVAQTAVSIGFGTGLVSGFQITGTTLGFTQYGGPALFSGPVTMPVFLTGTFTLPRNFTQAEATLRISQVAAAVPEPVTWAMMLAGFAMIGGAMRSRKPRVTFARR